MKAWILYTSNNESMVSGIWTATPGTCHATYTEYEFIDLIEGSIISTPGSEESMHVGSRDDFVVKAGFTGTWEIN